MPEERHWGESTGGKSNPQSHLRWPLLLSEQRAVLRSCDDLRWKALQGEGVSREGLIGKFVPISQAVDESLTQLVLYSVSAGPHMGVHPSGVIVAEKQTPLGSGECTVISARPN